MGNEKYDDLLDAVVGAPVTARWAFVAGALSGVGGLFWLGGVLLPVLFPRVSIVLLPPASVIQPELASSLIKLGVGASVFAPAAMCLAFYKRALKRSGAQVVTLRAALETEATQKALHAGQEQTKLLLNEHDAKLKWCRLTLNEATWNVGAGLLTLQVEAFAATAVTLESTEQDGGVLLPLALSVSFINQDLLVPLVPPRKALTLGDAQSEILCFELKMTGRVPPSTPHVAMRAVLRASAGTYVPAPFRGQLIIN